MVLVVVVVGVVVMMLVMVVVVVAVVVEIWGMAVEVVLYIMSRTGAARASTCSSGLIGCCWGPEWSDS